jgi:hypothetical protein
MLKNDPFHASLDVRYKCVLTGVEAVVSVPSPTPFSYPFCWNVLESDIKNAEKKYGLISDTVGAVRIVRKCGNNNCSASRGCKRCSRCRSIYYCSRECQEKDWVNHKPKCKANTA